MSDNKKVEALKGTVTRPFSVASSQKGQKPKNYKVGDKFETRNQKLYDSLIDKKRIKK